MALASFPQRLSLDPMCTMSATFIERKCIHEMIAEMILSKEKKGCFIIDIVILRVVFKRWVIIIFKSFFKFINFVF